MGHRNSEIVAEARAAHRAGNLVVAEAKFRAALDLAPDDVDSRINLGDILQAGGRLDGAMEQYQLAIVANPTRARAHYNLGVLLKSIGRQEDAAVCYGKAIEAEPRLYQAWSNLGEIKHDQGAWQDADALYRRALDINADDPETLNNYAVLLRDRGRFDAAVEMFERALVAAPGAAEIHRNKAMLHLLQGDYGRGWQEYEWRWHCRDMAGLRRPFHWPIWDGAAPGSAGALLVWGEQGLGDEILYASMAPNLSRIGCGIVWEADPRLVTLFARSFSHVRVIPRTSPPSIEISESIVAQIPSASLGRFYRLAADCFPRRTGYLRPDAIRTASLRARLASASRKVVVGISWESRNAVIGAHKSIPLERWMGVLSVPDVVLVDLQYGDTSMARAAAADNGRSLIHLDDIDLTADLDAVAALIAACDVVVTVSNTVAHLASALGVPTLVLVPASAGRLWYWGSDGARSPWYDSTRIIRPIPGSDLQSTLDVAAIELRLRSADLLGREGAP